MADRDMTEAEGARYARELEGHVGWLDSFTGAALGVLAAASGIYTYLGVSSLLDDNGSLSVFAALAYSAAVSVGIFVFWSYLMPDRIYLLVEEELVRYRLVTDPGD